MALTATVVGTTVFGDQKVVYGTFTNASSTTSGTVTLGLGACSTINVTSATGTAGVGGSYSGTTLTIYCGSTESAGSWWVSGK